MRKLFIIPLFFIIAQFTLLADEKIAEEIKIPGFGNQLILTNPNVTPQMILKRTMGGTKYRMTPGDTYQFTVQLDTTTTVPIILDDNYALEIPFIGNIDVRGMYFSDVRNTIIKRIKAKVPVQFVDFTLTSMALIDVLIYGGVENPGIATVTPLNTLWDAILMARGFKKGASYRKIEIMRQNKKTVYDLAKFVREGDLSQNPYLEIGDKIFVPHPDVVCIISGNVMYPDTYELVEGESLSELIQYSGGLLPGSFDQDIEIARFGGGMSPKIERIKLQDADRFKVSNGDRVRVKSVFETKDTILVEGALYGKQSQPDEPQVPPARPIIVSLPYIEGSTLLQVVERLGGITPLAQPEKSYVIRKEEKIAVDLKRLIDSRDSSLDVVLKPDDHIYIPMRNITVALGGEVVTPGAFPYQTGATVMDYVKLAGGLHVETADLGSIFVMDDTGKTTRISLDTVPAPGALIYVGKSGLNNAATVLTQVGIIVGVTASIIGLVSLALDVYNKYSGRYTSS